MTKQKTEAVREVRTLSATDLRAVTETDGKQYLEGYAARYNVRSSDLGFGMYEIMLPGAFTRALSELQDVRHLINHDPSLLLGRTKSGTTILTEDTNGLKFRTLLPNTQVARDLVESVIRGDINECSFGFVCKKASWTEETDDAGATIDVRHVSDVDLFDISTVTYPAYPQTSASLAMRAMFPEGVPAEIRAKMKRDAIDGDPGDDGTVGAALNVDDAGSCRCACPYCEQGNCEFCCNQYCREECCLHAYPPNYDRSAPNLGETRAASKKTKRVDGEDLPESAFLIVGDPDDPETWKLPVEFSTEEKTVNHIHNALSRFDELKDVPADAKKEAWARLEKLAEGHDITVSDEDKAKHRASDPAEQAAAEARASVLIAKAKLRALYASL